MLLKRRVPAASGNCRAVNSTPLPVNPGYRARLRLSLYRYADQFVSRPEPAFEAGWSDLEALQQVTLSDVLEESLRQSFDRHQLATP